MSSVLHLGKSLRISIKNFCAYGLQNIAIPIVMNCYRKRLTI